MFSVFVEKVSTFHPKNQIEVFPLNGKLSDRTRHFVYYNPNKKLYKKIKSLASKFKRHIDKKQQKQLIYMHYNNNKIRKKH